MPSLYTVANSALREALVRTDMLPVPVVRYKRPHERPLPCVARHIRWGE